MNRQALVLDANILIRAVLGQRVFKLLNQHHSTTAFFAPDDAFTDAKNTCHRYLKHVVWTIGAAALSHISALVQCIGFDVYCEHEATARRRIRDVRDWPVLATALALDCPVWTEIRISLAVAWQHGLPAPWRCI